MEHGTTILVKETRDILTVTFNRAAYKNSINTAFINELNDILNMAEENTECKIIILEGQNGVFCTGMDFDAFIQKEGTDGQEEALPLPAEYMKLIKRLTLMPKIIISKVDGQAMAGGIGFLAASDYAVATPSSTFSLSEALWGLLPAMVIPYLIRRVGYRKAYTMTLTTLPLSAQQACDINLVDEINDKPDESILRLCRRITHIEQSTVGNMKQYFRDMWIITDEMEQLAVSEITRLASLPQVRSNIENFVKYKQFPWERRT